MGSRLKEMKGHEEQCRNCRYAQEFIGTHFVICTYNNNGLTDYYLHEYCAAQWDKDPQFDKG